MNVRETPVLVRLQRRPSNVVGRRQATLGLVRANHDLGRALFDQCQPVGMTVAVALLGREMP